MNKLPFARAFSGPVVDLRPVAVIRTLCWGFSA